MRRYLMQAPWWVLSVVTGVPFGVAMVVGFQVLPSLAGQTTRSLPLIANVILGMTAGVVSGVVMGRLAARHNRQARSVLGPLPAEDFAVVLRASARGAVPPDPRLRRAAGRLAQLRLDELNRNRAGTSAVFLLGLLLEVYAAVVMSAWFWLGALVFVSAIVGQLWSPAGCGGASSNCMRATICHSVRRGCDTALATLLSHDQKDDEIDQSGRAAVGHAASSPATEDHPVTRKLVAETARPPPDRPPRSARATRPAVVGLVSTTMNRKQFVPRSDVGRDCPVRAVPYSGS
jgi:hypothetical protein